MRIAPLRTPVYLIVLLTVCTIASLQSGCQGGSPRTPEDYLDVINDESSGMIHRRTVNGMQLTMRLLPPGYLRVVGQQQNVSNGQSDTQSYETSTTFLLTVDTENESSEAILRGVTSLGEYDSRIKLLHFGMKEYLSLQAGADVLKPALVTLENDIGLRSSSNLYIVFAQDVRTLFESSKSVCVSFRDPTFGTGINRFCFDSQTVLSHPQIGIAS